MSFPIETIVYTRAMNWRTEIAKPTATATDFVDRIKSGLLDTYEVTSDGMNRLYFDIDGAVDCDNYSADIANQITIEGKSCLMHILEEFGIESPKIAIASAHSASFVCNKTKKEKAKYSARYFVDTLATKDDIKYIADCANKMCKDENTTLFQLLGNNEPFDMGIYDKNRKMRCVNTSKPGENRPLVMFEGDIKDTVITGFHVGLESIDIGREEEEAEAEAEAVAVASPAKVRVAPANATEVELYVRAGLETGMSTKLNGYPVRQTIAFILHDAMGDNGEDLFVEWYRGRASFTEAGARAKYKLFASATKPAKKVGIGTLIKMYKDTDSTLTTQIIRNVKRVQGESLGFRYARDDAEATNIIVAEVRDVLKADEYGRVFLKEGHIWICDNDHIKDLMMLYIRESRICYESKNGEYRPYVQNRPGCTRVYENLMETVRAKMRDATLYKKFHTTTKARICFQDGILDFKARNFYRWDDVDFEYYTTIMIPYDFGEYFDNPNKSDMAEVKSLVYDTLFNAKVERGLHFLSRAVAGHVEDKNFGTHLGNRNGGKGVAYDNLSEALPGYIKSFVVDNILAGTKAEAGGASRALYWVLDHEFTRLAINQESPPEGTKISSKIWKQLCGGNDDQIARRNFDKKDAHIKIDATFMIMGNEENVFDKNDVWERGIQFESVIQFEDKAFIDNVKKNNEGNPLAWAKYRVQDPSIKTDKCPSMAWKKATVMLLYESYKPTAVVVDRVADDSGIETIRDLLFKVCEITGTPNDLVQVSVLTDLVNGSNKKITVELESMGVEKVKQTAEPHRNKWCFVGIKLKPSEVVTTPLPC